MKVKKETAFGVVLGVAAGLLVDSILSVFSGAFLLIVLMTFLIAALVPIALGIMVGIRVVKGSSLKRAGWPVIVLVALLAWPAAVYAPIAIQEYRLNSLMSEIPVYPGMQELKRTVNPYAAPEGNPSVSVTFVPATEEDTMSEEDVESFYRDVMRQKGWEERDTGDSDSRELLFSRGKANVEVELYIGMVVLTYRI